MLAEKMAAMALVLGNACPNCGIRHRKVDDTRMNRKCKRQWEALTVDERLEKAQAAVAKRGLGEIVDDGQPEETDTPSCAEKPSVVGSPDAPKVTQKTATVPHGWIVNNTRGTRVTDFLTKDQARKVVEGIGKVVRRKDEGNVVTLTVETDTGNKTYFLVKQGA